MHLCGKGSILVKNRERRRFMGKRDEITPNDFTGVYRDIAEVIGIESTIALHRCFQGQQITLPKKLFTHDYILTKVKKGDGATKVKTVAAQYGYTERRLRQIMKEHNNA